MPKKTEDDAPASKKAKKKAKGPKGVRRREKYKGFVRGQTFENRTKKVRRLLKSCGTLGTVNAILNCPDPNKWQSCKGKNIPLGMRPRISLYHLEKVAAAGGKLGDRALGALLLLKKAAPRN